MIKKIFICVVLICFYCNAFPPPPISFEVENTNDSGPGSLREAAADFIKNQDWDFGVGIFFEVPNVDKIVITLESDIVIEDAEGWIGSKTYGNQTVTITGKGKLILKRCKVRLAENIKHIFQPRSLLELAAYTVANMPWYMKWQANPLPIELKELINKLNQPKQALPVVPKKLQGKSSEPCIIS